MNTPDMPPISESELKCTGCGYSLTGAVIGGSCPECGASIEQSLLTPRSSRTCGAATASMVVGIVSLAVCAVVGPVAIVLYFKAMRDMSRGAYGPSNVTMARAGLIMGVISSILLVLGIVFAIVSGL